jgi:hypothetical protein
MATVSLTQCAAVVVAGVLLVVHKHLIDMLMECVVIVLVVVVLQPSVAIDMFCG